MGPAPQPAPPTDTNMPPSQPVAHPLAIYAAQNPVISAAPAVLGPSFYPQSVISDPAHGPQERSIRTADQLTLQHPAQPSRPSNQNHADLLNSLPLLRVPDSFYSAPAGAVSDRSAQRAISPAHPPIPQSDNIAAAGIHMMGQGLNSQHPPTPQQPPLPGTRSTGSHPGESALHTMPTQSDATGISATTRSLKCPGAPDVAQMPTQPGQQSAGSMATAVMQALMGGSNQSFQGQAHVFQIGNAQNPAMAVNHARDKRQDLSAALSNHRIPATPQAVPSSIHRSLPLAHPSVPKSLAPAQPGAVMDPTVDWHHDGHNHVALGSTDIRASQVVQGGGSAGDFEAYTMQLSSQLSSIDGVRHNPASAQPVATMSAASGSTALTPKHAPHPMLNALAATVQATTGDAVQHVPSSTSLELKLPQPAPTNCQEPLPSNPATRGAANMQNCTNSDQAKRLLGRQPGLAAGRKRNPLHTRPLSKPLPRTQADANVTSLDEPRSRVPCNPPSPMPPPELPLQVPEALRPPDKALASRSLQQSTRTQLTPFAALSEVDGSGAVHCHTAAPSAVKPVSTSGQAANALVAPNMGPLSTTKPARAAPTLIRPPPAKTPRVNAPQPLVAPARHVPPAALPRLPSPRPVAPIPSITPAIADPMQRTTTTKVELAVLAGACQPSEVQSKTAAMGNPPEAQSRAGVSAAAKSVRPALSFGGTNRVVCAVGQAVQPAAPPAPRVRSSGRPSVLTRKLLAPAEPPQKAAATASKILVSNPPSSSRTESVQRDESDAALDTALSSSTDAVSPRTPSPQSTSGEGRITVKHLLDAGLLKAGPQVLHMPLDGCMHAAGVRCDGTLEYRGKTVCNLAGLFDRDTCKLISEEKAWRLVRYGRWSLRHYRRLYCLDTGALCPPGALEDPLSIVVSEHPSTALLQSGDDDIAVAAGYFSSQEGVGAVEAMQALDGAAVSGQTLSGMKRTRRQAAVLQASEAEELSEALMKPAKLPASLPFNCLFERGIVRFGALPAVAAAPSPAVKAILIKPASLSAPAGSKPPGVRPVGRPPSKLAKPAAKPVAKPAVKLAAKATAKPAVKPVVVDEPGPGSAKATIDVKAPETNPLLQAIDKMQRLPPMPRKVKTLAATMPRAPTAAPSSTAICPVDSQQRSRRDVRAPPRHNGISGLDHTMMQLEAYSKPAGEKGIDAQPFAVDVHPAVVAAMDIHAHMCQNEVIGVLGGTYESDSGRLQVLRAVSVQEGPLDVGHTDVEMDAADQSRAIEELRQDGLQCVGWYHSHPTFAVWPSAIDVYNQNIQQVARSHETAAGNPTPYIAAIVGPYDQKNVTAQSCMSWFYVENKRSSEFSLDMDPELCLQHMVPKLLVTNLVADAQLDSNDLMDCAARLVQKYASYESRIEFREFWRPELTNLQKLVSSLFHSVRAYLGPDELKEVGNRIVSEVMQHFYGVVTTTASRGGNGRQGLGGKPARLAKKA